jgi:hypothetical protein
MYCPSCGTETNDLTKYCTKCGINLRNVKEAILGDRKPKSSLTDKHEIEAHSSDTHPGMPWWWHMAMRDQRSPEEKRINEIKEGVITTAVGIGITVFLLLLMPAVSIGLDPKVSAILLAVPFAGVIPFLIGLALIFNGIFLSKRLVGSKREEEQPPRQPFISSVPETAPVYGLSDRSTQAPVADFSVTEETTTRLQEHAPLSADRDIN